jgi:hypothetical protein
MLPFSPLVFILPDMSILFILEVLYKEYFSISVKRRMSRVRKSV